MLSGDADFDDAKAQLLRGVEQLSQVFTDADSRALLSRATDYLVDDQVYQTLKSLRGLLAREERLIAAGRA